MRPWPPSTMSEAKPEVEVRPRSEKEALLTAAAA